MAGGKPGRACSICIHPNVAAINHDLASGREQALVAREFKISPDALSRHRLRHLRVQAAEAEPMQVAPAGDILSGVADLQTKVLSLLRRAEKARNFTAALGAIREAARLLELHGRLTGQISPDGARVAVQINGASGRNLEQIKVDLMEKIRAMAAAYPTIEGEPIAR